MPSRVPGKRSCTAWAMTWAAECRMHGQPVRATPRRPARRRRRRPAPSRGRAARRRRRGRRPRRCGPVSSTPASRSASNAVVPAATRTVWAGSDGRALADNGAPRTGPALGCEGGTGAVGRNAIGGIDRQRRRSTPCEPVRVRGQAPDDRRRRVDRADRDDHRRRDRSSPAPRSGTARCCAATTGRSSCASAPTCRTARSSTPRRRSPPRSGSGATIAHQCMIHGAVIEEEALVGNGCVVLDGARIGSRSLIAAMSLVQPGRADPARRARRRRPGAGQARDRRHARGVLGEDEPGLLPGARQAAPQRHPPHRTT